MVLTIRIRIEINDGVPYKRKRKYKRSKNMKIIVGICPKINTNDNIANKGQQYWLMYEWADWKPTNKNKNLMEIETATCARCFKTARENAIRTSQNEKETLLEEIKGHFQDPKGHFVTWFLSLHPSYPPRKYHFWYLQTKLDFLKKKEDKGSVRMPDALLV